MYAVYSESTHDLSSDVVYQRVHWWPFASYETYLQYSKDTDATRHVEQLDQVIPPKAVLILGFLNMKVTHT
jgi:hypothetical protein